MAASNAQIASKLRQLAALVRHEGGEGGRFKSRAYERAADAVASSPQRLGELIERGEKLPKIPGVGASIASAIAEVATSGTIRSIERLSEKLPPGTTTIAEAAGIPVRDAKRLIEKLHVTTAEDLRGKLERGEVGRVVGSRLEFKIRNALAGSRRLLWEDGRDLAERFRSDLEGVEGVRRAEVAGSVRRGKETVGTLRIVVETGDMGPVVAALARHGGVEAAKTKGRSIECRLGAGLALRVRVCRGEEWGAAIVEETGSEAHLEEVRAHARPRGKGDAPTEEAWYAARGLEWIPPELREGRGEVEAAANGWLPKLVEPADIRGDLHAHTTASDGANTIEEMVRAAKQRGYSYLAITDHSKNLKITNGLDEKRLREQGAAIDRINAKLKGFRVLKGSEVDILEDGSLDFDDETLAGLDVVMASVHSRFRLDKDAQTERILRAIKNPYLTCLGHLTGRLLLKRPGYELDLDRVLRAVKRHGKLLEINSSPDRLDIDDALAQRARAMGIPLLINTDAHSIRELGFMAQGVQQARRGWQSAETIVNTLPLAKLLKVLQSTRSGSRPRAITGSR